MIKYNKNKFKFKQKLILIESYLCHRYLPVEEVAELLGTSKNVLTLAVLEWIKNDHYIFIESKMNKL